MTKDDGRLTKDLLRPAVWPSLPEAGEAKGRMAGLAACNQAQRTRALRGDRRL